MCLVALTTGSSLAGTVWDVNADFSNTNGNPNGAWSYGWVNNSAFQLYEIVCQGGANGISPGWCGPYGGAPVIWKNTGIPINGVQTGQLVLHPGPDGEMSAAQWTAPADWSGDAAIQGQFFPGDIGSMQVGIFKNGNWGSPLWGASNSGAFNLSQQVVAGDTIDFGVYDGYSFGSTPLEATITTAPIDWKGGSLASTDWNVAANWNPDTTVPNGSGTKVSFGNQLLVNNIVDMISQGQTVGAITFSANTSTIIQSSGKFALTLDNNGSVSTIDVAGTHTISAPVILNNDATISGTGTLNLSGGITGSHNLEVDIDLTATSIQVDTLTIGSGITVTIAAIPGGPLAGTITAVPEPSTLVLLGIGAISLLAWYSPTFHPFRWVF